MLLIITTITAIIITVAITITIATTTAITITVATTTTTTQKISKSSSYNLYEQLQPPHSSRQVHNVKLSTHFTPPLLNDNIHRNNNFKQQQQPFQRCFKCGFLDHIARHYYHF
ncbi:unnamed protein product [Rotaria sp. Silwood2]|nr:unnamed protein product [Rotaria sp. Silwood2]CAF4330565.1 unnamed protein product [Rotaria sp. Silwood2]CAF4416128.1 unnamed protein product [Rotaria sp. Silwood2]